MVETDFKVKFEEKLKELENTIPNLKGFANCAELTLTSVLEILGVKNHMFHNVAIPLAGGFGGYKSKTGWQGACGAVSGGICAIGAILGGQERIKNEEIMVAYMKASQFATEFEKHFGSVVCPDLCGYDFSQPEGITEYVKNDTWVKKCHHFVLWAVDEVWKLTKNALKKNWQ
jgi:C_GCAxxG_C_C family probable redox protein